VVPSLSHPSCVVSFFCASLSAIFVFPFFLAVTASASSASCSAAQHCSTALQHTATTNCHTMRTVLQCTATRGNTRNHTATRSAHCNILQHAPHTAPNMSSPSHTATHCAATHYNTLQHAVTRRNTLQLTPQCTLRLVRVARVTLQHTARKPCHTLQHTEHAAQCSEVS